MCANINNLARAVWSNWKASCLWKWYANSTHIQSKIKTVSRVSKSSSKTKDIKPIDTIPEVTKYIHEFAHVYISHPWVCIGKCKKKVKHLDEKLWNLVYKFRGWPCYKDWSVFDLWKFKKISYDLDKLIFSHQKNVVQNML